jgi:hypothetical protein
MESRKVALQGIRFGSRSMALQGFYTPVVTIISQIVKKTPGLMPRAYVPTLRFRR